MFFRKKVLHEKNLYLKKKNVLKKFSFQKHLLFEKKNFSEKMSFKFQKHFFHFFLKKKFF